MFIKYLAYTNQFDGVLNDREIEEAKLGHLPADLDVHHIFPIAGSESEDVNSFTNLTVLHKTTHIRINREIFAPQLPGNLCSSAERNRPDAGRSETADPAAAV